MADREKNQTPDEGPQSEPRSERQRNAREGGEVRKGARTYRPRPSNEPRPSPPAASTSQGGSSERESSEGESSGGSSGSSRNRDS